jgi:hypothetical protein
MAWVLTGCAPRRLSQAKTLADGVGAARFVGRVRRAALGRPLLGPPTAQHRIQRTWRFVVNRRVEVRTARPGVVRRLVKRRRKPGLSSLDGTALRGFCTLLAAAVLKGRAVPRAWARDAQGVRDRSPNHRAEGWWRVLRTMLPPAVPVLVRADRGFGRSGATGGGGSWRWRTSCGSDWAYAPGRVIGREPGVARTGRTRAATSRSDGCC